MTSNEKEKKEKPIKYFEEIGGYFEAIDKYCKAVDKITPELQKDIAEKNEISMPLIKLAEMMGYKFLAPRTAKGELVTMEEKILNSVYWRTKFCLFKNGIVIEPKKIDHEGFITMRPRPLRLEELRHHVKRTSLVENF